MADKINYGVQYHPMLGGLLQQQEDNRFRMAQQAEEERRQQELQMEQEQKAVNARYMDAQIAQMRDNMDMKASKALYDQSRADEISQRNQYPALAALSADTQAAMKSGDMARLYQNAMRYKMMEEEGNLPGAVKQVLNSPSTYKYNDQVVESNFDPEMLAQLVANQDRSKAVTNLQQQDMRNQGNLAVQDSRNEGNARVAGINAQAKTMAAQMAKKGDIKNLQGLLARYIQDGNEEGAVYVHQLLQTLKPTAQETTIGEDGLERVDKTTITQPPAMPAGMKPGAPPAQPAPQQKPPQQPPAILSDVQKMYPGVPADKLREAYKKKFGVDLK